MEQAQSKVVESQESTLGGFDPRVVHERDQETQRIKRVNAHKVICFEGIRYYEWPKGSRNLWWEDRTPAGRLNADGRPVRGEAHVEWEAPIDLAQELEGKLKEKDFQTRQLMKELEALKKEKAAEVFATEQKKQQTANKMKAADAKTTRGKSL